MQMRRHDEIHPLAVPLGMAERQEVNQRAPLLDDLPLPQFILRAMQSSFPRLSQGKE